MTYFAIDPEFCLDDDTQFNILHETDTTFNLQESKFYFGEFTRWDYSSLFGWRHGHLLLNYYGECVADFGLFYDLICYEDEDVGRLDFDPYGCEFTIS